MNLSIITACIPFIKPFLGKLRFGFIDPSIPIKSGRYALHSYPKASGTGFKKHLGQGSKMNGTDMNIEEGKMNETNPNIEGGSHAIFDNNLTFPNDSIYQTREFRVDIDDNDSHNSMIGFHL